MLPENRERLVVALLVHHVGELLHSSELSKPLSMELVISGDQFSASGSVTISSQDPDNTGQNVPDGEPLVVVLHHLDDLAVQVYLSPP